MTIAFRQLNQLDPDLERSLKEMLQSAFEGDFTVNDWAHAIGGEHFIGFIDGKVVAHGAVVPRSMEIDGQLRTVGYVEAFAVLPEYQRQGLGTELLQLVTEYCHGKFGLSMLSTDDQDFYQRLGWRKFLGESFISTGSSKIRSAEEDEGLMFFATKESQVVDIRRAVCESRAGDSW